MAIFASVGLFSGILCIAIFAAFLYVAAIVSIKIVSVLLSFMFKGRSVMGFVAGFDDRLLKYASVKFQKETVLKTPTKLVFASEPVQREVSKENLKMLKYASIKVQKRMVYSSYYHRMQFASPIVQKKIILDDMHYKKLQHASEPVQIEIIREDPVKLQYASEAIKNDPTIKFYCEYPSNAAQKEVIRLDPAKLQYASEAIKNDRAVVQAAVAQDAGLLAYANVDFQRKLIASDFSKLQYASEAIKNDMGVVQAAVTQDARLLAYASVDLQRKFVAADLANMQYASDAVQKEIIREASKKLQHASEDIKNNQNVLLYGQYAVALKYASVDVQKEIGRRSLPRFMEHISDLAQRELIEEDCMKLQFANEDLQRELVAAAPAKLQYASEAVQREFVAEDITNMQYASDAVQRKIIREVPEKLQHASEAIKNNQNVLLYGQYAVALKYASVDVQKEIGRRSLPRFMEHISDLAQRELIEEDCMKLQFANEDLQRELVAAAPTKLQYASKDVQKKLVYKDRELLKHASFQVQSSLTMHSYINLPIKYASVEMQRTICQSPQFRHLQYASVSVQRDLVSEDVRGLQHASEDLQRDLAIVDLSKLQYASEYVQRGVIDADIKHFKHASRNLQQHMAKNPRNRKHAVYMHEFSLEQIQEKAISRKYKNIKINGGIVTLSVTEQELSEDILLALLATPQMRKPAEAESSAAALLEYYENKLNIIYAAMSEMNLLRGLVKSMVDAMGLYPKNHPAKVIQRLVRSSFIRRGKIKSYQAAKVIQKFARSKIKDGVATPELLGAPVAAAKFDLCIDRSSLPQLCVPERRGWMSNILLGPPLKDMSEFMKSQLQVIICKNTMPSRGGLADFRAKFIEYFSDPEFPAYREINRILSYYQGEISKIKYEEYLNSRDEDIYPKTLRSLKSSYYSCSGLTYEEFADKKIEEISAKVKGLDDEGFMFLVEHLNVNTLVSLRKVILSSNNEEIAASLQGSKGLQAAP